MVLMMVVGPVASAAAAPPQALAIGEAPVSAKLPEAALLTVAQHGLDAHPEGGRPAAEPSIAHPTPAPTPAAASTSLHIGGWHIERGHYVALGTGGTLGPGLEGDKLYAATGLDVRSVNASGQGGFFRLEQGDTSWLPSAPIYAPARYVLALDMGWAFGGPLAGVWNRGLLGFVELGVTSWHASSQGTRDVPNGDDVEGLGMAVGASLEGHVDGLRFGLALERRDVPFFLGSKPVSASSMTLQVRLDGEL